MTTKLTTPGTLGSAAIGSVEPAKRLNEITRVQVVTFSKELQDADSPLYRPLDSPAFMPRYCIDGRHAADPTALHMAPNSAGGVFTLLVTDMLTSQTFRSGASTTAEYAKNLFGYLNDAGYEGTYGDHDQEQAAEDNSGCGAVDYMPQTIAFIAKHSEQLRKVAGQLEIPVDPADHDEIIAQAKKLSKGADLEFSHGDELRNALAETAGQESVVTLTGDHHEVTFVVNNQLGTSIDPATYDDTLQAFNYDRWAMQKAVHVIGHNLSEHEARRKLLAADYFNLATICVLAGPSLFIVARPK